MMVLFPIVVSFFVSPLSVQSLCQIEKQYILTDFRGDVPILDRCPVTVITRYEISADRDCRFVARLDYEQNLRIKRLTSRR